MHTGHPFCLLGVYLDDVYPKRMRVAKETVQAAKVLTKLGLKKPKAFLKDPEKSIIDFLNDILVLFLIKLHWEK